MARRPSSSYRSVPTGNSFDHSLLDGVGDNVCAVQIPVLSAEDSSAVEIEEVQPVASYSWVEKSKPTILVPSSPPVWAERSLPFSVEKDNFTAFVDQNAHRVPTHPLIALVAAVVHMHPDFSFASIDLVSDRNSLRKLLRWVRGREMDPTVKDFRFDVELIGTTMLFTRHETKTVEFANRGYGLGFEKAVTTQSRVGGLKCASTGHNRIVRYNLEGLELLVRFELDACLPEERKAAKSTDLTELLARLDRVGVSSTTPATHNPEKAKNEAQAPVTLAASTQRVLAEHVDVVASGTLVEQSRTVELTTCSKKFIKTFSWAENYPQLFLSQTANHYLGLHDFGKFSSIEKRSLASLSAGRIGEEQQGDLKRLGKVLHRIYDRVVEEGPGTLLSLVCVKGVLTLRKRTNGKRALPEELTSLFTV